MELCVALDLPTKEENLTLVRTLKSEPLWLKVGLRSFIRDGASLIEAIKTIHPTCKLFLDLKLHDIPNTMADAAESIMGLGVEMFNIHASAGEKAMRTVMERVNAHPSPPYVLAVTALTSFDHASFEAIYHQSMSHQVIDFAKASYESGLSGVVCSVFESQMIKTHTHTHFMTLTPGIRPFGEKSDDQERVADLAKAKAEGSDFIVVGRPIYQSSDPLGVVQRIVEAIAQEG